MAEQSVKTNIVKVLLCELVKNSLTPTGGKNSNKISILFQEYYKIISTCTAPPSDRTSLLATLPCTCKLPQP